MKHESGDFQRTYKRDDGNATMQDLRGFEDTAAHKASQLSPQKRVAFSHSLSMPIPRRTPAAAPAADARELRSVQSMMPSHHSDVILGTPVLQRTSMPTVQVSL